VAGRARVTLLIIGITTHTTPKANNGTAAKANRRYGLLIAI